MPDITLTYGGVTGVGTSKTFSAHSVRGFRPTDGHEEYATETQTYLNGMAFRSKSGFRRQFVVDLGPVTTNADLIHLGWFMLNEEQRVTYAYNDSVGTITETDLRVVDKHSEYESPWLGGMEIRNVVLELEEADVRTSFPSYDP